MSTLVCTQSENKLNESYLSGETLSQEFLALLRGLDLVECGVGMLYQPLPEGTQTQLYHSSVVQDLRYVLCEW